MKTSQMYRGKSFEVEFNKARDKATVTVEGRSIKTMLHTEGKPEENYIKVWMCPEAYAMFEINAAKYFVAFTDDKSSEAEEVRALM